MKRWLKQNAWVMYLGAILSGYGITFADYRFYVIVVPVTILVAWAQDNGE